MLHKLKKPVSQARATTEDVKRSLKAAKADLHGVNRRLEASATRTAKAKDVAKATIAEVLHVEQELSEATDKLATVAGLLKTAERDLAIGLENAAAGNRTGEGVDSVLKHLS